MSNESNTRINPSATLNLTPNQREKTELIVDSENKKFQFCTHSDSIDDEDYFLSGEYRFEDLKVMTRVLEESSHSFKNGEIFSIRDGVVLESDVRNRHEEVKEILSFVNIDEKIIELRNSTNWRPENNYIFKYFLISLHPEVADDLAFRRLVRSEIESHKTARDKAIALAKESGCSFEETEKGHCLVAPTISEESLEKLKGLLRNQKLMDLGKLMYSKKILSDLENILERRFEQLSLI